MLPYLHLERFSLTRRRAITGYVKYSVSPLGEKLSDIFGIKNTYASLTAVAVTFDPRWGSYVLQQENKFFVRRYIGKEVSRRIFIHTPQQLSKHLSCVYKKYRAIVYGACISDD